MRSFQGAVLFIDMLGFSALTRGKLPLDKEELEPWKVDSNKESPHQLLAAKILISFRKVLMQIKHEFSKIKVAQLSDCAFLWSNDVGLIADAGRNLMHKAALMGLLCRGGLAFGNIIEPDKVNHSLGAFIVGDAVTKAVSYEAMGKGMRIFTDSDAVHYILKNRPAEKFNELVNPLTGHIVDEWQWYAPNHSQLSGKNDTQLLDELNRIVSHHTMLRYSPKLAWSASTPEGRQHIACSIVAVSDAMYSISGNPNQFLFTVEQFLCNNQSRSDRLRNRIQQEFVNELLGIIQFKLNPRSINCSRNSISSDTICEIEAITHNQKLKSV